ncbi:hypothetical protein GCM10010389_09420 [Streptomyces echinoruber]|uniref:Uncharacterized protein n=1 Tax=Streptomyces echinoruber TaxID=68898 RepID=A0A918QY42_9ACTN|nr:hypothetical protein GCM10010389_09420 [Streptomyces echinoruber]
MSGAVDVETAGEGVQEHTFGEVVRERHRQIGIVGLLKAKAVVLHIGIEVLLPDKHGHESPFTETPFTETDDWSSV